MQLFLYLNTTNIGSNTVLIRDMHDTHARTLCMHIHMTSKHSLHFVFHLVTNKQMTYPTAPTTLSNHSVSSLRTWQKAHTDR